MSASANVRRTSAKHVHSAVLAARYQSRASGSASGRLAATLRRPRLLITFTIDVIKMITSMQEKIADVCKLRAASLHPVHVLHLPFLSVFPLSPPWVLLVTC